MKEPDIITCPNCGKETPGGEACRNCGKDIESLRELEVQYRDFKGSEMLDIKMSSPARKRPEDADNDTRTEKKAAGKNKAFFFLATAVIILSAIAWYFLLKSLLKF